MAKPILTSTSNSRKLFPARIPLVDLRYKHLEAALAEVLSVRLEQMGAFRARLRHLRNIGLPLTQRPGKGSHITYSGDNALEMLLTLQLQDLGHPPSRAWVYSSVIMMNLPPSFLKDKAVTYAITYPTVLPVGPEQLWHKAVFAKLCFGLDQLMECIKEAPPAFYIVNVTERGKKLVDALNRAVASL